MNGPGWRPSSETSENDGRERTSADEARRILVVMHWFDELRRVAQTR
jgi:hypothetical protein